MRWDNFRRSSNVEEGESGGLGGSSPSGGFRRAVAGWVLAPLSLSS